MRYVLEYLSLIAPFTFVFCLIYAIRDMVKEKEGFSAIALGLGAAVSLLVMVQACMIG